MREIEQLNVNKDNYAISEIISQPKFGFILIKLDLGAINIDPENASFIDLDITKTLNLEMKLNI